MRIGYFLSTEEWGPADLLAQARAAENAGFEALWISDHFHPWTEEQGHSPFVWSVIGALSQVCRLPVTTAVTCPTVRFPPPLVAQAAATSAVMHEGRFTLGVGTGEALNEHILGDPWPSTDVRLEMLEEAVAVIRALWSGEFVNHRGRYYTVDHARIYTLPERPPRIYMSGFGPKSISVAARIADGYITTTPDPEAVRQFRTQGGGDKPVQGGFKAAYAADEEEGVEIALRIWPSSGVPGELSQVLTSPRHFEQAAAMVERELIREKFVCGRDPEAHLAKIEEFERAGFDEVYVTNVGPHYDDFFQMYAQHVLPARRPVGSASR